MSMQNKPSSQALITLDKISARVNGRPVFRDCCWQLFKGQRWAIIGPNGSGKTIFANLLNGRQRLSSGSISFAENFDAQRDITYVSFEEQQALCARDAKLDMSEYSARAFDAGTTVARLILAGQPVSKEFKELVQAFHIDHILEHGIRYVSSGEMRKSLIARALLNKPALLILDNPLEGLDAESQKQISELINHLMLGELSVLLISRQQKEILPNISHIMLIQDCAISLSGTRQEVMRHEAWQSLHRQLPPLPAQLPATDKSQKTDDLNPRQPLIKLDKVSVCYGGETILDQVSWTMKTTHHTAIAGPNGAGKSTLLTLITGDNPQAYGQQVWLFGRKRGSGESIWDIKRRIGWVANALQQSYTESCSVFNVIASGFFNTIGLYDDCSPNQKAIAREWVELLDIRDKIDHRFDSLSFGEQRMVLLARAMVKNPLLLILDEPCSGLDDYHRQLILRLIDFIAGQSYTQIIYVSHQIGEQPDCINQQLQFKPLPNNRYQLVCE
jgi:molybdate transport system ATP-binding protein